MLAYAAATIGFENTGYTFNENQGQVNICVAVLDPKIRMPASFPFQVEFSTTNETAGLFLYTYVHIHHVC